MRSDTNFINDYVENLSAVKQNLIKFLSGMTTEELFQIINLFPFLIEEGQLEKLTFEGEVDADEIERQSENSIMVQEINVSGDDMTMTNNDSQQYLKTQIDSKILQFQKKSR